MTNTLSQTEIVNIVKVVKAAKSGKIESKKTVDHMRSRTTQKTMQLAKNAERELMHIGAEIATLLDKDPDIDVENKVKPKFRSRVGSIIANTVRESYLLGLHFVENFEKQTIKFTEDQTHKMNMQIDEEIQRFWNNVKSIQDKQLKKKYETETNIFGASFGFDLAAAFSNLSGNLSVSMSFLALGDSTVLSQNQAYQQQIRVGNVGITATATIQAPKMIWVSERDGRVCPECKNLDGLVFSIDDPSLPRPVRSTHFGCRCRLLPLDGGRVFNA